MRYGKRKLSGLNNFGCTMKWGGSFAPMESSPMIGMLVLKFCNGKAVWFIVSKLYLSELVKMAVFEIGFRKVQFPPLSQPEQFLDFACRFADDSGETGSGEGMEGLRIEAVARIGIGAIEGKNLGAIVIPGREIGGIDANDAVNGLVPGIDKRDKRESIGFDETRPEAALVF